jgi:ribose transport system ATP-binding protein
LLGHNGSGKSTLIKVLAGFHQPDSGSECLVGGEQIELGSSEDATKAGVRFVHQDLGLIAELSAVDNVALTIGYERSRTGRVLQSEQVARTHQLIQRFGVDIDVTAPIGEAPPVTQTCVAIARAMWDWDKGPRVLVLDEPTASLPSREVARLFDVLKEIRAAGHAIVFVSHRMDEIFAIGDSVTVLRNGRVVARGPVEAQTRSSLSELIAGRELEDEQGAATRVVEADADIALSMRNMTSRYLHGIDLDIHRGEIVGVAGLLGSGRDELPYLVAGALPYYEPTELRINGEIVGQLSSTTAALERGIALVPAERDREGLILDFTVQENLTLAALSGLRTSGRFVSKRKESATATSWLREIGIPTEVANRPVNTLSGGNKQRVLMARCLYANPTILCLAEPTAGVDIGARGGLYEVLRDRADHGLSILLCSSDVEDLTSICDRVIVLREGKIKAELTRESILAEQIVQSMEGGEA